VDKSEVAYYLKKNHIETVNQAAETISKVIRKTPMIESDFYSNEYDCEVYIKAENMQRTGAFKLRGAYNKISRLEKEDAAKGVIAASAGNHAQGVAYSAKALGLKATIVMPQITPLLKVNATKGYGADVILHGDVFDESNSYATSLAEKNDLTFIHPFDDYDIIAGQGTIAKEILEDIPDADMILAPIGGGGLMAGIAMYAKSVNPNIEIIGIEPIGAMSMKLSLKEGSITRLAELKTSAEGVAVKQPGDLSFALCKQYVDEVVSVSEKDIMESVLVVMEKHKLVAETAGVLGLAALRKLDVKGKKVVCVLSGGNIDTVTISSIINEGMISKGRIMCFSVELPDRPGQLVAVASLLSEHGANVIELEHNQFKALDRYSNKVVLEVTVETNGPEHIRQVLGALEDDNYNVRRIY
jgi:threonine dehydratase